MPDSLWEFGYWDTDFFAAGWPECSIFENRHGADKTRVQSAFVNAVGKESDVVFSSFTVTMHPNLYGVFSRYGSFRIREIRTKQYWHAPLWCHGLVSPSIFAVDDCLGFLAFKLRVTG